MPVASCGLGVTGRAGAGVKALAVRRSLALGEQCQFAGIPTLWLLWMVAAYAGTRVSSS
jgi:hypothetical protein